MSKRLQQLNWGEVQELLKKSKLAIIPTGSTEQHGPHLPLGTDYLIADHIAQKVSERIEALVTPVIPVGFAQYHTDFPGTLSIPNAVLIDYYQAIADSLIKYGITHILFLNGHGGNSHALSSVCFNLRNRGFTAAYINWFELPGNFNPIWSTLGHGDHFETSVMLSISPEDVDMSKAINPVNKKLTENIQILDGDACQYKNGVAHFSLMMRDATDTGGIYEYGHATHADYSLSVTEATAENGAEAVSSVVDYIVDFVEEFKKINFNPEV